MSAQAETSIHDLENWFSHARMSRFTSSKNPQELYVWNTRITKGLLEDIQHVEVLLRNKIDAAMSTEISDDWLTHISFYDPNYQGHGKVASGHDAKFTKNVYKAIQRSGAPFTPASKGHVIAELSFDHWRFLLTRSKEPTAWIYIKRHLPDYPLGGKPRQNFENLVEYTRRLRNRLSHHEPVTRQSLTDEHKYLCEIIQKLDQLAQWINTDAAQWIRANSRIQEIWACRPNDSESDATWIQNHPLY